MIIDTPPALNSLTVEALISSVGTLVPLQCEYYSLEGISSLLNTITSLGNRGLSSNKVVGIIRTMVDMRNNLAKSVSDDLEKHFPDLLFNTLIPRNVKLAEAPSHGLSGTKYMPESLGAKAYIALTGEFLRRIEVPEKPILNKGLDALLGDVEQPNANIVKNIPTNKIAPNRYQPRTSFNDEKLSELADSIKQHGILSPIIVRSFLDQYEIIAGERRFRAAKNLKLKEVPCLIENTENQQSLEIALIENLQRENLNPLRRLEGTTGLKGNLT